MRVIEPSEIIIEQQEKGRPRANITHVNPWIRFLARMFDYSLLFFLLLALKKIVSFGKYDHLVPFEFLVWVPIEALFLNVLGTTPGKFLLGTKLKRGKKRTLEFAIALRRSFLVWFRGMGMGIPFLNFFCLTFAYHKLNSRHLTSWDKEDQIEVTHYPIGRWRLVAAIVITGAGFLLYYSKK